MTSARTVAALLAGAMLTAPLCVPGSARAQDSCPALRWTTLGTAGGPVPTPDRSEPANLLDAGGMTLLVDAGDGSAVQLARAGRQIGAVDAVVLSHLHWDHTGGLGAVIGLRWMNEVPGVLTVYGPPGTTEVVDGILASLAPPARVGYGTGAHVPDPAEGVRVVELANGAQVALANGLVLDAAVNTHFDEGLETVGTTSLSYRFSMDGRSIAYSGDTGPSEALTRLATGADMLVSEVIALEPLIAGILATRPDLPERAQAAMRQHLSTHHIDAAEVGRMAGAAGVGHLVLTHFAVPPQPLRASEPYLRDGVRQHYAGPLDLATDLASFDVGCD